MNGKYIFEFCIQDGIYSIHTNEIWYIDNIMVVIFISEGKSYIEDYPSDFKQQQGTKLLQIMVYENTAS